MWEHATVPNCNIGVLLLRHAFILLISVLHQETEYQKIEFQEYHPVALSIEICCCHVLITLILQSMIAVTICAPGYLDQFPFDRT